MIADLLAALEATLDALASGVYLTDHDGRVAYMNRAGQDQLKTGNALRIVNGHLSAVSAGARATMAQAIADAATDNATAPASGVMLALPGECESGLVATIKPLGRSHRRSISRPPAAKGFVAVFIQDPAVAPQCPGEAFAKLYGLTGGELRVLLAMAMAPGLGIKEAGDMLGISETTAKTHLQRIYSKTNTSRQPELISLFRACAPPVRSA